MPVLNENTYQINIVSFRHEHCHTNYSCATSSYKKLVFLFLWKSEAIFF